LNAAEVAAAALDPKNRLTRAVERIGTQKLRAGITAPKIRDAKIRTQQIGAITKELRAVERAGDAFVPKVSEVGETFLSFHAKPCRCTKEVDLITRSTATHTPNRAHHTGF
jgi:hypothetical protein